MAEKVLGFIIACKLFLRIKMREDAVEEQIQWILSYIQGESVDICKENMLEDLKSGNLEYETVEKFLADLKKEFGGGDKKAVKVVELRKSEQGGRTMKEFVQGFRRAAIESGYKKRPLVEEFKRGMNRIIRRELMEAERSPTSIEQ